MATPLYNRPPAMDLNVHAVESYRFDLLRDAFPTCYRRVAGTEWLTLMFGPDMSVTFFRV